MMTVDKNGVAISLQIKWLLMICIAGLGIGATMIFTVLPPLARDLGLSETAIGLSITLGAIVFTFMAPFWGHLSEHMGRKKVLMIGFWGQALSYILLAAVIGLGIRGDLTGLWLWVAIVLTRLIFGFVGSGSAPASAAYISDISTDQERTGAIGTVMAGFGLGMVIGPVLGAFFLPFGSEIPFGIAAAFLVLAGLLILFFVREPVRHHEEKNRVQLSLLDQRIFNLGSCLDNRLFSEI